MAGQYPGILKTKLDGFNQIDYLTGKSEKSARDRFFYYSAATPSAVRYKNWKLYYKMAKGGAAGWIEPLTDWHFPLIQNIKRDPFEQNVSPSDTKSLMYFGGSLSRPEYSLYVRRTRHNTSRPALVAQGARVVCGVSAAAMPETYNLGQVLQEVKKAHEAHPED